MNDSVTELVVSAYLTPKGRETTWKTALSLNVTT